MAQRMSAFEHYERGLVLKQVQIFESALEEFQRAAIDPQHAGMAYVQMALCLKSTGRCEEAVTALRQALRSPTFSTSERVSILYLLGQTYESLARYADALETYGWVRREDPGFRDVSQRIKHLTKGGRVPFHRHQMATRTLVGGVLRLGRQLRPQLLFLLGRVLKSLTRHAETPEVSRWVKSKSPQLQNGTSRTVHLEPTSVRCSSPVSSGRPVLVQRKKMEKRQYARVPVRLRSHFSSKSRAVTGEGELRDLSPGGCRVASLVAIPVGAELECCIFPQDGIHPFTIEGALVRWSRPQEFGLAFTKVRPGVQQQIANLCRRRLPLGL